MKLQRLTFLLVFLSFTSPFYGQTSSGSTAPDQLQPGIVVERVLKGSETEKAGLREGDVFLGWTQGSASGSFIVPFDLNYIEVEQRSSGRVTITGYPKINRRNFSLPLDSNHRSNVTCLKVPREDIG